MSVTKAAVNSMKNSLLKWPKVLLFGDSITQFSFSTDGCWGALLADHLQRKCDVVQRGFSGYNTRWNKLILPRIVDAEMAKDLAAVVILLGANDSNRGDLNPTQHIPLEEYKLNLVHMVEYLMSVGVSREKVILISPPPCDETTWAKECEIKGRPMSKDEDLTKQFAAACCIAATESGAQSIDLYTAMKKQENWASFLNDGLHLSTKGSVFLDSLLWPRVEKLTESLPMILPAWDEVDYKNPEKSLTE